MKGYLVEDLDKPVFSGTYMIMAESPIEAVKKAGYVNVKRAEHGNIVVRGSRALYVYTAEKPDEHN